MSEMREIVTKRGLDKKKAGLRPEVSGLRKANLVIVKQGKGAGNRPGRVGIALPDTWHL